MKFLIGSFLIAIASLTTTALSSGSTVSTKNFFNPAAAGPYPVGVTTTVFVDHKRIDTATKEDRTLVTEIWYPATDETRNLPKNKFSNFLPGGPTPQLESLIETAFKKPLAEVDRIYWNNSVRDARVREGKFPLIIFSHGNRSIRNQSTFWCDYLASHGYIIVSADHTGNSALTIINGKPVFYQLNGRANSVVDRPKDMIFLLDQMSLWNGGADSRFSGKIDLSKIVAAGMSFGSMTAIRVADLDPRFKAVVAMAGSPEVHTNLNVPSLYMMGDEDRTIGVRGNELIHANYARHTGPAVMLELKNGGHYSFSDIFKIDGNYGDGIGQGKRRDTGETFNYTAMDKTYQIINSYTAAFLGYFSKGEHEYAPYLLKNHWPDELIEEVKGIEQNN
ncbi:MAG: dienelactone hydrolase family protein [Blastocatellia bacterium]|nr:dienelactone hydrolase family protein [Blastocatellia bacterium]